MGSILKIIRPRERKMPEKQSVKPYGVQRTLRRGKCRPRPGSGRQRTNKKGPQEASVAADALFLWTVEPLSRDTPTRKCSNRMLSYGTGDRTGDHTYVVSWKACFSPERNRPAGSTHCPPAPFRALPPALGNPWCCPARLPFPNQWGKHIFFEVGILVLHTNASDLETNRDKRWPPPLLTRSLSFLPPSTWPPTRLLRTWARVLDRCLPAAPHRRHRARRPSGGSWIPSLWLNSPSRLLSVLRPSTGPLEHHLPPVLTLSPLPNSSAPLSAPAAHSRVRNVRGQISSFVLPKDASHLARATSPHRCFLHPSTPSPLPAQGLH